MRDTWGWGTRCVWLLIGAFVGLTADYQRNRVISGAVEGLNVIAGALAEQIRADPDCSVFAADDPVWAQLSARGLGVVTLDAAWQEPRFASDAIFLPAPEVVRLADAVDSRGGAPTLQTLLSVGDSYRGRLGWSNETVYGAVIYVDVAKVFVGVLASRADVVAQANSAAWLVLVPVLLAAAVWMVAGGVVWFRAERMHDAEDDDPSSETSLRMRVPARVACLLLVTVALPLSIVEAVRNEDRMIESLSNRLPLLDARLRTGAVAEGTEVDDPVIRRLFPAPASAFELAVETETARSFRSRAASHSVREFRVTLDGEKQSRSVFDLLALDHEVRATAYGRRLVVCPSAAAGKLVGAFDSSGPSVSRWLARSKRALLAWMLVLLALLRDDFHRLASHEGRA